MIVWVDSMSCCERSTVSVSSMIDRSSRWRMEWSGFSMWWYGAGSKASSTKRPPGASCSRASRRQPTCCSLVTATKNVFSTRVTVSKVRPVPSRVKSPSRVVTVPCGSRARSSASMGSEPSIPCTVKPCPASGTAIRPVPTPSSRTLPPGGVSAATNATACSVSWPIGYMRSYTLASFWSYRALPRVVVMRALTPNGVPVGHGRYGGRPRRRPAPAHGTSAAPQRVPVPARAGGRGRPGGDAAR